MSQQNDYVDITIVGAGPVGLFAATYASMHQASVRVLESLPEVGGQVKALFASKAIYDIPGFVKINGAQLIAHLKEQLAQFNPEICCNQMVQTITPTDEGFEILTNHATFYSKKVILTTGIGAFSPRKLRIKNADELTPNYVCYQVDNPQTFSNLDVAVAGGGDSAIDWALAIEPYAKSVSVIHRRDEFRALPISLATLKASNAKLITPYLIKGLEKTAQEKLRINLLKAKTKEQTSVIVDKLLVNYGLISSNRYLSQMQLKTKDSKIEVDRNYQTSQPGIFAVGDCATYPGRVALIASGFGEVPHAVVAAMKQIHPNHNAALHSTQLMEQQRDSKE